MAKYIDMHCHLDGGYNTDAACVAGVVYNATSPGDWADIVARTNDIDVFGAIGIHPWYVDNVAPGWDAKMLQYLERYPNLMVGEIGLDKNHPDINLQADIFARQIQIAAQMHRMAHIHCVGAWDKMLRILAGMGRDMPPLLFHSFSGTPEVMDALLKKYDAYFSFSSFVADMSHKRARACVMHVPPQRIVAESDAKGLRALVDACDAISQIRGCDMTEILYNNARGLLNHG